MKTMNFQNDLPSILFDNFKDLLVFNFTSLQHATEPEHSRLPVLVGHPLKLELIFSFALEHVKEFIVLGQLMSLGPVHKFSGIRKNI